MSDDFKAFLASGKRMIYDTKLAKPSTTGVAKKQKAEVLDGGETDPHKRFVKHCVRTKPDTKELIKEFEKFIEVEEAKL